MRTTTNIISRGCAAVLLAVIPLCGLAVDVQPWRTELRMPPGDTLEGSLTIRNEKTEPVVMVVSFRDLSLGKRREQDWMLFPTARIPLGPNETAKLPYQVSLTHDATGEYFGRIGFVEEQVEEHGAVSVRTKISVPICVIVEGTEKYEAQIEDVRVLESAPLSIEVFVSNTGNVQLRAKGDCTVVDRADDVVVAKLALNKQGFPMYPGRVNRVVCRADDVLDPGSYNVAVRLPFPDAENLVERTFRITIPEK